VENSMITWTRARTASTPPAGPTAAAYCRSVLGTDVELRLAESDIVRVNEQPSEQVRKRDEALWHIAPGQMFTTCCSRWIDRVGRACTQLRRRRGPRGLPPR
ncbi:hypothetical protein ACFU53_44550, partial [Streptomyces sp. NPDC057474]|uniref:hypothetical protein n=1 Tax=Streptomyces sp. NPDC057474 TaxID=3346144 RepID=UPI0036920B15